MARDSHFGTGEYDPRAYWSARAERCAGDLHQAVCGYGLSAARNRAMDRVQRHLLAAGLGRRLDGRRLLDFGCGGGRLTRWFKDRGAAYTGVDLSPEMVELARRRRPRADFRTFDGETLPFASGAFDVAVSVTVLHHNPYAAQALLLDELVRVVRPGGRLFLLERVGPRRTGGTLFTLYPRPADEWVAETARGGRATLVRHLPARWWIVADAAAGFTRRLAPTRAAALDDRLLRWTSWLDPRLLPLLPRRRATAAALLFRRRIESPP